LQARAGDVTEVERLMLDRDWEKIEI